MKTWKEENIRYTEEAPSKFNPEVLKNLCDNKDITYEEDFFKRYGAETVTVKAKNGAAIFYFYNDVLDSMSYEEDEDELISIAADNCMYTEIPSGFKLIFKNRGLKVGGIKIKKGN